MQKYPSIRNYGIWAPVALFLGAVLVAVLLTLYGPAYLRGWMGPAVTERREPDAAVADFDKPPRPPESPDMLVCDQFRDRKNAGDPTAADLLGPAPAVPATPVSREEADRLQTEFFLRQEVQIVGVGRDAQLGKPVLYTHGNVSAPTLPVRTETGVESAQRTMSNPDLVVEVRDGRIYGVAAHLHW